MQRLDAVPVKPAFLARVGALTLRPLNAVSLPLLDKAPLHLDALYRAKVAALKEALGGEDAAAARERIRALIDAVVLTPSPTDPKAPLAIDVRGRLAAMLALGSGQDEAAASALASQFKLVAGARNQLDLLTRG